ncbi:unnamed protein product, partial [Cunninghamella echinulata]
PSDLHRIRLSSVKLSNQDQIISLQVHYPNEKRKESHIIKLFKIKNRNGTALCPINTDTNHSLQKDQLIVFLKYSSIPKILILN